MMSFASCTKGGLVLASFFILTCGELREVTASSLAQAAHMELALALVTQDHGAVAEGPQGKVRPPADVAAPRVMVQIMNHISATTGTRMCEVYSGVWRLCTIQTGQSCYKC